jgi:hypothetical protein
VADQKRKEGDYLEALVLIKKAFYVARPSESTFVPKDSFFSSFSLTSGLRGIRELRKPIEKIIDKINELEESIASLMMGVDVLKLQRFDGITPHFTFTGGGCIIRWDDSVIPTEEIVEEAVNYVVDMTLLWQRMGVVGSRPEWLRRPRKPWREVRREGWHYARIKSPIDNSGSK